VKRSLLGHIVNLCSDVLAWFLREEASGLFFILAMSASWLHGLFLHCLYIYLHVDIHYHPTL